MTEIIENAALIYLIVFASVYALLILGLVGIGVHTLWKMCKDARKAEKKDRENRI